MTKVEKNQTNLAKCSCLDCPSYNTCAQGKDELLYCASEVGKSGCPYEMKGCVCGGCPVHTAHNLTAGYFCLKGSAEQVEGAGM